MIHEQSIQEIGDSVNIAEVISHFLELKPRGSNFIGLCPFHNEKTPSFSVSPSKGLYKCFGCDAKGDTINFLMEHEQYTFVEAVRYLAEKYNIQVKETSDGNNEAHQFIKKNLFEVNLFALNYFTDQLCQHPEGQKIGYQYFNQRGLNQETIRMFHLGYAPNSWDDLYEKALKKGFSQASLFQSDLILLSEKKNTYYNKFRERIIFPIHNLSGSVLGFAGRLLKKDDSVAKYINSKETKIFQKSKILYGLYQAKKSIVEKKKCYIVEGYMDVITLFQHGIRNCIASCGTAFTQDQAYLIKRFCPEVILLFDGDLAGNNATLKNLDVGLKAGLDMKVAQLPEKEDPDSYLKKLGIEKFEIWLSENAQDWINFKSLSYLNMGQENTIEKSQAVQSIIQSLAMIEDKIKRQLYIKQCATLIGIKEENIIAELNKKILNQWQNSRGQSRQTSAKTIVRESKIDSFKGSLEKEILKLLILHGGEKAHFESIQNEFVAHIIFSAINFLSDPLHQKIYLFYKNYIREHDGFPTLKTFFSHDDQQFRHFAHNTVSMKDDMDKMVNKKRNINIFRPENNLNYILHRSIYYHALQEIKSKIEALDKQLEKVENDQEEINILQKINDLKKNKRLQLAKKYGITILG